MIGKEFETAIKKDKLKKGDIVAFKMEFDEGLTGTIYAGIAVGKNSDIAINFPDVKEMIRYASEGIPFGERYDGSPWITLEYLGKVEEK